jgi:hypothetical protein
MSYTGHCVGGPLHNQILTQAGRSYRMPIYADRPVVICRGAISKQDTHVEVKTGEYRWVDTLKRWEWRP